mgnify:CR=1 FL=1
MEAERGGMRQNKENPLLTEETERRLVDAAITARKSAYAPYSAYLVGAAVLCVDGSIYTGGNIENASYGATVCAERVAILKAVNDGRAPIAALAVAGSPAQGRGSRETTDTASESETKTGQPTVQADTADTDALRTEPYADGEITQAAYPCGICRQVLREFADPRACVVLVADRGGRYRRHTLAELLPESFDPAQLGVEVRA